MGLAGATISRRIAVPGRRTAVSRIAGLGRRTTVSRRIDGLGRRTAVRARDHTTTNDVTHLVWMTPGRSGPINRRG